MDELNSLKDEVDVQGRFLLELKRQSWSDPEKSLISLNWAITINDEMATVLDQSSPTTITKKDLLLVKNLIKGIGDWLKSIDSKDPGDHHIQG